MSRNANGHSVGCRCRECEDPNTGTGEREMLPVGGSASYAVPNDEGGTDVVIETYDGYGYGERRATEAEREAFYRHQRASDAW